MTGIKATNALVVGVLAFFVVGPASAQSLAGQAGNKHYPANFTNVIGDCPKAYKDYVAAGGHSAYAATPSVGNNFVCGVALNARSEDAAQKAAVKSCEAGLKRFKINAVRRCLLYASK